MKFFRYSGYIYGDRVAGIVKADNIKEARCSLKNAYDDYHLWSDKTLKEVKFDDDNVCEVYYG